MTSEQSQVLELLAFWVRFLSLEQVARLFPGHKSPTRAARRLIETLLSKSLVTKRTLIARAPTAALQALFSYRAGDSEPDFKALSQACRARRSEPARATHVIQLAPSGAKALGAAKARTIRSCEATHDLQMAEVTLAFWRSGEVEAWMRDDQLARSERWGRDFVPDAEALFKDGSRIVVECGGSYSAKKLETFHRAVTERMEGLGVGGYQLY